MVFRSVAPSPANAPVVSSSPLSVGSNVPDFLAAAPSTIPLASTVVVSPKTSMSAGVVIAITDTGFEPATSTIKAGTAVTFTNNGQGLHWPASNPHPSHTTLSGFDALRGLATGESYTYTFTKVGTWGWHDHLYTQLQGTVVVQ